MAFFTFQWADREIMLTNTNIQTVTCLMITLQSIKSFLWRKSFPRNLTRVLKTVLLGNRCRAAICSQNILGPFLVLEDSIQKSISKDAAWFSFTIYRVKIWGLSGFAGWSYLPEEVWLGQCPPVWIWQQGSKCFPKAIDCKTALEKWTLS